MATFVVLRHHATILVTDFSIYHQMFVWVGRKLSLIKDFPPRNVSGMASKHVDIDFTLLRCLISFIIVANIPFNHLMFVLLTPPCNRYFPLVSHRISFHFSFLEYQQHAFCSRLTCSIPFSLGLIINDVF